MVLNRRNNAIAAPFHRWYACVLAPSAGSDKHSLARLLQFREGCACLPRPLHCASSAPNCVEFPPAPLLPPSPRLWPQGQRRAAAAPGSHLHDPLLPPSAAHCGHPAVMERLVGALCIPDLFWLPCMQLLHCWMVGWQAW